MAGRTTDPGVPRGSRPRRLLRIVDARLRATHGTPRLGNPRNSLDDLIFIMLSSRTHEPLHLRTYRDLKKAFPSWGAALQAGPRAIEDVIHQAGLGPKKSLDIYRILLTLQDRFGRPTLAPLKAMSDAEAERFLTELPGVGLKSARCVMLYTLDRAVFPVDVHTIRVLSRLHLVNPAVRPEFVYQPLQLLVPLEIRYSLHVNLVAHGRAICLPVRPACGRCPLLDLCPSRPRA